MFLHNQILGVGQGQADFTIVGNPSLGNFNPWTPSTNQTALYMDYANEGVFYRMTDQDWTNQDFTLEFWFSILSSSAGNNQSNLVTWGEVGIYADCNSEASGFNLIFELVVPGAGQIFWENSSGPINLSYNTYYHTAIVRSGTNYYTFLNGSSNPSANDPYAPGTAADWNTNTLDVGAKLSDRPQYTQGIIGFIDEVRISNTARYTGSSYTVPTQPFTVDANTYFLIKYDTDFASTYPS